MDPDFINPAYPVDSQAERAVVAALLDSPKRIADVWPLLGKAEVMGNEAYRAIITALYCLFKDYKPIKLSSVIQHLNESNDTKLLVERGINLQNLTREAALVDLDQSCIYLRGLWVKRMAVDAANDILAKVPHGEPVDHILDKSAALYESLTSGLTISTEKSMKSYVSDALTQLDQTLSRPGQLTGVTTGLSKLDRHLGGWQSTDVVMIAGRPGMGKSVAGVFHALSAASAGVSVGFVSLEMPARSLVSRMISARTNIPYSDINKRQVSPEQLRTIHMAAGNIEQLPIYWYEDHNRDINDLAYVLLNWKRKHDIGLVIIDYVQLCTDRTVKSGKEYDVLTEVSRKLQQLRKRLDVPIIELAQLNRSVESRSDKRARIDDLRSTGQFEQDASLIVMLYRPDYYAEQSAQETADKNGSAYISLVRNHVLEYNILKNRDGYTCKVILHADVSTNTMNDIKPVTCQSPF